ncbi:hypothetical protein BDZ45DRAFT_154333 [Acephala macrosclerotiorum]|nr:hypothetical protein BDZ45DRAFT_154333 [Acephala macrosclerotiorum]
MQQHHLQLPIRGYQDAEAVKVSQPTPCPVSPIRESVQPSFPPQPIQTFRHWSHLRNQLSLNSHDLFIRQESQTEVQLVIARTALQRW